MLSCVLPFAVATGLALALTIANTHAGGWAVVTVEDLPERIVVGAPTTATRKRNPSCALLRISLRSVTRTNCSR